MQPILHHAVCFLANSGLRLHESVVNGASPPPVLSGVPIATNELADDNTGTEPCRGFLKREGNLRGRTW